MLQSIYKQLLIVSFVFGVLYLFLRLLSKVTLKYFTAKWHYYSYLLLGTFFLMPFHSRLLKTVLEWMPISTLYTAREVLSFQKRSNGICSYLVFLPYILMIGSFIFLVIILEQHIKIKRYILEICQLTNEKDLLATLSKCKQEVGLKAEVSIYIAPSVGTPFLSGIFKPSIVLPNSQFSSEELHYIFLHELTHLKRCDALFQYLMILVNVIHWFNPLVYLMRRDIDCFCELSNDECVVISMNETKRRDYCELILRVLWDVVTWQPTISAFSNNRKNLERRIHMILEANGVEKKKRNRKVAMMLTLVFIVAGELTLGTFMVATDMLKDNRIGNWQYIDSTNRIELMSYSKKSEEQGITEVLLAADSTTISYPNGERVIRNSNSRNLKVHIAD